MSKDTNKKNNLILIITHVSFIIIFIVGLILTWNHQVWDGIQFDVEDGSVFTDIFEPIIDSLEYMFGSESNIVFSFVLPIVQSILLMILLFVFCNKKSIEIYNDFIYKPISVSILGIIGIHILLFFISNSIIVMLYNIAFGTFFISLLPFILVMVKTCYKCGYFNTKKCISETTSETHIPKYVEGGYKTVKADVKDTSGSTVGTIEVKKYEEGHTYISTSTTKTIEFICLNCGNITKKESSS